MSIFKTISPGTPRFQEIEFLLLAGWTLLFPDKSGYFFYLGFVCLLLFFMLGKAAQLKNVAVTRFSFLLLACNAVLVFSVFFSPHPYKSLLFIADFFLVSAWFALFYLEKEDGWRYFRLLALVISLSSLGAIVFFALQKGQGTVTPFFTDPVLQGVASSLAVLVFLQELLQKYSHAHLLLLALNSCAVVISASPAACWGLAVLALVVIVPGKRRWLLGLVVFLLLPDMLPAPRQRLAGYPQRFTHYAFDRLGTWGMSARMARANPWTGVGPGLFAEAARRFNFASENGESRYGQVPESPRSDFWQVIAETGMPGLVLVVLFLFFAIRRLLSPPRGDGQKWLLAFLMLQMLLSNCVFNPFFLLVFFLLLYGFFSARPRFVSPTHVSRVAFSCFLGFLALVLYGLPFMADRGLAAASREKDLGRRLEQLDRAAMLSPLDDRIALAKALTARARAADRPGLDDWVEALENARLAQRLNANGVDALLLESELFRDQQSGRPRLPALADEILEPLRRAEKNNPSDPFIKMRQAVVLHSFHRDAEARERAQAALDLEPDFAAALIFLHALDGLPPADPLLQQRLGAIRRKAERLHARPGTYLFNLHRVPPRAAVD